MAEADANPYPGPRPFSQGEAGRFFGRAATVGRLRSLVLAHRVVLLFGPSGVGKSSLVAAGLLPELGPRRGMRLLPSLRVGAWPAAGPLPEGANVFTAGALSCLGGERVAAGSARLADGLAGALGDLAADPRGLAFLHLDQFEELFSSHPGRWRDREAFCRQLTEALDRFPRLLALISLREDYLAPLEALAPLFPDRLRTRLRLEPLGCEEAVQAVVGPAQAEGVDFDPVAARELMADLATLQVEGPDGRLRPVPGPTVEPVHLQVVCRELWERTQAPGSHPGPTSITVEALGGAGQVGAALERFYRGAVQAAATPEVSEARVRDWIGERLIGPGRTRKPVLRDGDLGLPDEVVEGLLRGHLLRQENRGTARVVELAHDRLVKPVVDSNRAFLASLSALERHALDWHKAPTEGGKRAWVGFGLETLRQWRRARRRELRSRRERGLPGWWRIGREWLRSWRQLPELGADPLTRSFVAACLAARRAARARQRRLIGWFSVGGVLALLLVIVGLVGALLKNYLTFGRPGRLSEEALLRRDVQPELALLLARESIEVDWIHLWSWRLVKQERVQNGRALADLLTRPSARLSTSATSSSPLEGPWQPPANEEKGGLREIELPRTAAEVPGRLSRAWWLISQARPRRATPAGSRLFVDPDGTVRLSYSGPDRLEEPTVGHAPGPLTLLALSPPVGHYFPPESRRARLGAVEHLVAGFAPGWGLYLWHLPTRNLAAGPLGDPRADWVSLAFAGDGKALFVADGQGRGRRFELDPDRWAQLACNLAGRDLTAQEIDRFLPRGAGWQRRKPCVPERAGAHDGR